MMSHQAAAKDYNGLKRTLSFSVRIVAFITIPAALGLMILREPIIRVLFQHGQFVASSTQLTARSLLFYAVGLPALASVKLIVPAFYSTHDTRTPVTVASMSMVLNIVLNILFLRYLFDYVQNGGPALATAIACYMDFFALIVIFRLRFGPIGGRQIFNSFAKIALCSAIMGVAAWFGMHYTEFTMHSRFIVQLLTFLALLGGATLLYLGAAWLFRCHELEEIYGIATRRRTPADAGIAET
jgi:putative peptidoglycan lipid II flippase